MVLRIADKSWEEGEISRKLGTVEVVEKIAKLVSFRERSELIENRRSSFTFHRSIIWLKLLLPSEIKTFHKMLLNWNYWPIINSEQVSRVMVKAELRE